MATGENAVCFGKWCQHAGVVCILMSAGVAVAVKRGAQVTRRRVAAVHSFHWLSGRWQGYRKCSRYWHNTSTLCLSMHLKLVSGTRRAHQLNPNTYTCVWCVYMPTYLCGCVGQCLLFTLLLVAPALEKTEALKTLCFGERWNSAVL